MVKSGEDILIKIFGQTSVGKGVSIIINIQYAYNNKNQWFEVGLLCKNTFVFYNV